LKGWRGRGSSAALQELKDVHPAPLRRGVLFGAPDNDLEAQTRAAMAGINQTLDAAGASFKRRGTPACKPHVILLLENGTVVGQKPVQTHRCHRSTGHEIEAEFGSASGPVGLCKR
jgi:hypothetical protein